MFVQMTTFTLKENVQLRVKMQKNLSSWKALMLCLSHTKKAI